MHTVELRKYNRSIELVVMIGAMVDIRGLPSLIFHPPFCSTALAVTRSVCKGSYGLRGVIIVYNQYAAGCTPCIKIAKLILRLALQILKWKRYCRD